MKRLSFPKILLLSLLFLGMISAGTALAGANFVPATHIGAYTGPTIGANDLKPDECASINLDEITAGSGTINGTRSNNLILGSNIADTINSNNQGSKWLTVCIMAGAGNDTINGSKKAEIILGGTGDDIIDGGGGYDICYGGGGNDTFYNCEETY
jgi:Ca2+-binding RTX toxin-like protein